VLHHSSVPYASAPADALPASEAEVKAAAEPTPEPAAPAEAAPADVASSGPVTQDEVRAIQAAWAGAIKSISATYAEKGDHIAAAANAAAELYAYGHSDVLFKPTKAAQHQFRPTGGEAMSYFVGGAAVEGGYEEDAGFAINGGKGWAEVVFENHQIERHGDVAVAMGNYHFTCATTGDKVKVEYTFGYKRCDDGKVRIVLHHSSVPYVPHASAPADTAPASEAEAEPAAEPAPEPAVPAEAAPADTAPASEAEVESPA